MPIPFSGLFKSVKERLFPAGAPQSAQNPAVRADKSNAARMSKTYLPNAGRTQRVDLVRSNPPPPGQKATTGGIAPRTISMDPTRKPAAPRAPKRASASGADPNNERTIFLQLHDIIGQLPTGSVKSPDMFDANRTIQLKASELEKGMANGKPSVAISSIYLQVPEIFQVDVSVGDATPVYLPLDKVMEQFSSLRVRRDQVLEQEVPQLDTPFLAVTLEDTERFGTPVKPLAASPVPPVKVEPATAKTIAAAEPEPAVRELARPQPARPSISMRDLEKSALDPVATGSPSSPSKPEPEAPPSSPRKIPFHLPPNGSGESASERVPASSGPPAPTPPPAPEPIVGDLPPLPPLPMSPAKLEQEAAPKSQSSTSAEPKKSSKSAFKFNPPPSDLRPKLTLVPGIEPKESGSSKSSSKSGDQKISLPLQPLLQEVPAFQLNGSPMSVGEDARIEFPLSLIEPQLASGRVVVNAKQFHRAMPLMHRELFVVDQNETPVTLPLQEILKHIPPHALRVRGDQVETRGSMEEFVTPFSIQAEEDAKRFGSPVSAEKPPDQPATEVTPLVAPTPEATQMPEATSEAKAEGTDAKQAIAQACELAGVKSCAITFADGLTLASNIPDEVAIDGICAMAPSVWQRLENHISDTKLGAFQAFTLHCAGSSLTFFMDQTICLAALHEVNELSKKTREKLADIAQKLSRTYSQPGADVPPLKGSN